MKKNKTKKKHDTAPSLYYLTFTSWDIHLLKESPNFKTYCLYPQASFFLTFLKHLTLAALMLYDPEFRA